MQGQATSTCQHWMGVGVVNGCLSAELAGRILAPPATPMWIDDGLVCGSQVGLVVDAKRSLRRVLISTGLNRYSASISAKGVMSRFCSQ